MQARSGVRYDAFISYSHAADDRLAPAVQKCLQKLGKRWYQVRSLRVFRDEASLAASPDLWDTIQDALKNSKYFIFLASPEAARSHWVRREIAYWRDKRDFSTFLIAVTDGEVRWDEGSGDFDWAYTTALPQNMSKWFQREPMWVDLAWARDEMQLSPDHSRFRGVIASLAAQVHDVSKEDLDSEDVRQHRLARRMRRGAVAGLVLLTVSALMLGAMAYVQRGVARDRQAEAERQTRTAVSRALGAEAEILVDDDPLQASRIALTGLAVERTAAVERSLMGVLDRNRHVVAYPRPPFDFDSRGQSRPATTGVASEIALSSDGKLLAFGNETDSEVRLWDVDGRNVAGRLSLPAPGEGHPERQTEYPGVSAVEMSADGRTIVTSQEGMLHVWDVPDRTIVRSIPYVADRPSFHLSPDGQTLAAIGADVDQPGPRVARRFTVTVWDLATGAEIATSPDWMDPGHSIRFTSDGRGLLGFDVPRNGEPSRLMKLVLRTGEWHPVLSLPAGEFATSTSTPRIAVLVDDRVEIWDYETAERLGSHAVPGSRPMAVAMSSDASLIVVGTTGGDVYAVDGTLSTWQLLTKHRTSVLNVGASDDGRLVASTSEDYDVTISTPGTDNRLVRLTGLDPRGLDQLQVAEPSPDGSRIAVYGETGLVLQGTSWADGFPIVLSGTVPSGDTPPSISWSPDSRYVAAAFNEIVTVWTAEDGREVASFDAVGSTPTDDGSPGVGKIRLLPQEGLIILTRAGDHMVVAVDYRTGETVQTLTEARDFVVSADGRTVGVVREASLPAGTRIDIWRWEAGGFEMTERVDDGVSGPVALSGDGTMLAIAAERRVVVRDIGGTRRVALRLPDGVDAVGPVGFSADQRTLIAGGPSLTLWDVPSGLLLGSWQYSSAYGTNRSEATDSTTAWVLSADLTLFVDTSNGSVHQWTIGTDAWRAALCGMALNDLDDDERDRYLEGVDVNRMCP